MTRDDWGAVVVGVVGLAHLPVCYRIRREVFVEGQDVPQELELDGLDLKAECTQFLAWQGGEPVGTARMRVLAGAAKAERVAVLAASRGRGLGRRLMDALERQAAASGLARVVLHAQVQVIPFYQMLGYLGEGDRFMEAGISHQKMSKRLDSL